MFQLCACHSDIPQYNSSETFRNVPLLLSHVCLCAVRFDGYGCSAFLWILRLFEKISGKIQAGKEMALHFWERHSKILPNRGRVEARVSANRPQCRRNGELSAGRKEISAVCASHPAAAYRNRRAVLARPPLCGVTAHRRRNFLCIPIPFPSAIGAQPPMS